MHNDAECCILAVAASTQTVVALLRRLVKDAVLDEHAVSVPWTILNKYYTANVEFLVHQLSTVPTDEQLSPPALLFVWNRGDPYRDHLRKLAQQSSQHHFQVALAIRLPPTDSTSPSEIEDEQDIDVYLSSKGFEFVDVPDLEASSPDRSGIPGVPRIIDALSTIMWPSMVWHTSIRGTTTGFIGAAQRNISSDEYDNLVQLVGEKISGNYGDRMRRELEDLERWLDQDTSSSDADAPFGDGEFETGPWCTAVTTISPSLSGFLESSRPTTPKAGFDDDFTSFISASPSGSAAIPQAPSEHSSFPPRFPPLSSTSFSSTFSFDSPTSSRSTPTFDVHPTFDATRLVPGESYRSLGSVSDFGDTDKESANLEWLSDSGDEEGEDDIPSQVEIAETSRRIFGAVSLSLSPVLEGGDESFQALTALGGAPLQSQVDVKVKDADLERFDLQSMLGALQGLKEEIAGMPDKERRKAAARVALGLAYGLDSNAHS